MMVLEGIGIGVLILLIGVGCLFLRRAVAVRAGGTIKLNLRVSTSVTERGWASGFGRFVGDELRWYRMFSFAPGPKRVLSRTGLVVQGRRVPTGQERLSLPADWVILRCNPRYGEPVEIAMASSTVTGFLSWLESSPPGEVSTRLAAR